MIQLFALISDVPDDAERSGRSRDIVRLFLSKHLNNEQVEKYMAMFDEYIRLYHPDDLSKDSIRERKRTSLTAMRILAICEKINEELHQKQKIYVLVQLMDFISFSTGTAEKELEFLETVAEAFNLDTDEYRDMLAFILGTGEGSLRKERMLVISSDSAYDLQGIKHLYNENLRDRLLFLYVASTNTLLMRYEGRENLLLNGQNIFSGQTYVFEHGSSVRGAGISPVYYNDVEEVYVGEAFKLRISLDARDISLRYSNSEHGIQKLSVHEESGKLVGIMGGSGVGKSTLLNILSGIVRPDTGSVCINGFNLNTAEGKEHLRGVIGFVPQDDLLFEELTVFQNLYYNARMCLNSLGRERICEEVKRILRDLDLYSVKNLKVGSPVNKVISGGQRKRLNIALELIREPTILFVDEPTSGL
ncbi:MAG: ABC transporter ATP-binding protein, partial [Mesotoga sp.]|nr:ABC transporter ATP-binding protein [Mesotoga sp.]